MIRRRDEGLLDRSRAHPTQQVQDAPGLVIGTRRTGSAERLLSHHCTRGLSWLISASPLIKPADGGGRSASAWAALRACSPNKMAVSGSLRQCSQPPRPTVAPVRLGIAPGYAGSA